VDFLAKYRKRRLLKALTKAQEFYNSDKYLKAIRLYELALEMIDESEARRRVNIYEKIGDMYAELDMYVDSKEAYVAAVKAAPNQANLRFSLAICHEKLQEAGEAKSQFAHAFWLNSDNASVLHHGACYLKNHGFAEIAESWSERAEKLDSQESWSDERE